MNNKIIPHFVEYIFADEIFRCEKIVKSKIRKLGKGKFAAISVS